MSPRARKEPLILLQIRDSDEIFIGESDGAALAHLQLRPVEQVDEEGGHRDTPDATRKHQLPTIPT